MWHFITKSSQYVHLGAKTYWIPPDNLQISTTVTTLMPIGVKEDNSIGVGMMHSFTVANIFAEAIFYGWNAIFLQGNISKSWLDNQLVFICVWTQSFCIKYTIFLHFHELHLQSYGFANYCIHTQMNTIWLLSQFLEMFLCKKIAFQP